MYSARDYAYLPITRTLTTSPASLINALSLDFAEIDVARGWMASPHISLRSGAARRRLLRAPINAFSPVMPLANLQYPCLPVTPITPSRALSLRHSISAFTSA